MKKAAAFLFQLAFLSALYYGSEFFVSWLHIPIPASVTGMVILLFLLSKSWVPVQMIESGAAFLNKHLAFFFIPIAAGLITYGDLIRSGGAALIAVIAGSSVMGLLITSGLSSALAKRSREKA
ncbi:CidA/LrgA family protein [Domibacillus sp. DTU_2020_1001157_1_SI_ALB_TIR_016]|uniref:CidA/LrgA family protein n=1 Tax=Domibacillus sp. DTU_2020_1001157_1_SI_ALB_TIR_016 TaxID=3077789 RepID=UPI0028EB5088|nr:CidA/LrgA family protein [Domibacillus sp. DTU_2020_1001157_1_SI_ALB_TIR_016]WNS82334.1 CidA/LrgA family protein [Domibacillus sp. DTU_2020_1001157_1_SI_ALB_TIR_016]